jgi:hypothetical protein
MTTDLDILPIERPRRLRLDWLGPLFWKPRQTLARIQEQGYATWITPLLVLTLLAIVTILVAGPIRQAASAGPQTLPKDFQYWAPEQQKAYSQSMAAASGATVVYVLPAIGELLKIWIGWFLLGAILHLVLTLTGSRGNMTAALNLAAWAGLPAAVRYAVQIGGMLLTHQAIAHPGLSGFAPQAGSVAAHYLGAVLPFIDIYLIWAIALLLVGLIPSAGISAGKAWMGVLVSVAILLLLEALPGFIGAQLGSLGGGGGSFPMGGIG